MTLDDPFIDPIELKLANERHDAGAHELPMDHDVHVRGAWNPAQMIKRGKLTDKKIAQYRKLGFYDPEYRKARKEFAERKQRRRQGNFLQVEGRMIYSPT